MTIKNRTEIINSFINLCIEENQLNLALDVAKLGTTKETIDCLVKACIQEKLFELGQEIARLGASKKVIELLVEAIISNRDNEKEWASLAFYTAKMGVSREVIDSLIRICIEEKKTFIFKWSVKEFGISDELAEFFIENSIEKKYLGEILMEDEKGLLWVTRCSSLTEEEIEESRNLLKRFPPK